jgi:soluble cytochrome b562
LDLEEIIEEIKEYHLNEYQEMMDEFLRRKNDTNNMIDTGNLEEVKIETWKKTYNDTKPPATQNLKRNNKINLNNSKLY